MQYQSNILCNATQHNKLIICHTSSQTVTRPTMRHALLEVKAGLRMVKAGRHALLDVTAGLRMVKAGRQRVNARLPNFVRGHMGRKCTRTQVSEHLLKITEQMKLMKCACLVCKSFQHPMRVFCTLPEPSKCHI